MFGYYYFHSEFRVPTFHTFFIDGTLRWQSPELMTGQSQLTQATDVWAFSISCAEILSMGRIPWTLHDDDSVRYFVLSL